MSKALVAIGVSRAPPLDPLKGAITDAHELAKWATENGYEHVHVLTDKNPRSVVRAADVFNCCKDLIALGDIEQLVIYFSGHGYCPLPGHEIWLLSGWKDDANEAINASTSILLAKGTERPRIAFIADACRDTSNEFLGTTGMVVLPKPPQRSGRAQVDEFYATAFGDPSQQYQPSKWRKSYGVFSKELLKGLQGGAAITRSHKQVVTSRSLQDHLVAAVPKACAAIKGALIQYPEANAHWEAPDDVYAELIGPAPPSLAPDGQARSAVNRSLSERGRRIRSDARRYQRAEGRESFETATGATVVGAEVVKVVHSAGHAKHFWENGAWQIRVSSDTYNEMPQEPIDLLVHVKTSRWSEHWMSVTAYPGLIATAMIDDNGFSSLSYRAARRFRDRWMDEQTRGLESISAEMSAMFRFGLMPPRERLLRIVDQMREIKFDNPAFAVLAAHICYRIGEDQQIYDMEHYPIGRGWYTPYDFLLLTGRKTPSNYRKLVGRFPLLSAGWGLLAGAEFELDERLSAVPSGLVPSLWTFADARAGALLADVIAEPAHAGAHAVAAVEAEESE